MATKKQKEYYEKLKDPRWQKKRLEIMERDNFECVNCGDSKSTLTVHHQYYNNSAEPWEYPSDSLSTLCGKCHEEFENQKKHIAELFKTIKPNDYTRLIGYLSIMGIASDFYRDDVNKTITLYDAQSVFGIADFMGLAPDHVERIFHDHSYNIKFTTLRSKGYRNE